WGDIVAHAKEPLSISRVLTAIWEHLHKPLSYTEYTSLCSQPGRLEEVAKMQYAAWFRCRTADALVDYERRVGYKRIDVLMGRTIFWGLTPQLHTDGTWRLSLGLMP
ncbi:hypothetical protein BD410DRAFT_700506, partial [Rickenella mellea]